MPIRNLHKIFKPQQIAVIGASSSHGKVGNTVIENLIQAGFPGAIYPVNPKPGEIAGLTTYASVDPRGSSWNN